jgi:hypothetical protein
MTKQIKNKVSNPHDNNIIETLFKDYEFKINERNDNKKKSFLLSVTFKIKKRNDDK